MSCLTIARPVGSDFVWVVTGKNCRCQTSTSLGNAYLQMDHFIDARDTLEVVVHNIGGVSTGRCTNRCIPSPEALSMPSASGGTCSPSQCRHQAVCGDIGPLLGACRLTVEVCRNQCHINSESMSHAAPTVWREVGREFGRPCRGAARERLRVQTGL